MTEIEKEIRFNEKRLIEILIYINDVFIERFEGNFTVCEFREYELKLIDELFHKYYPDKEKYTCARTMDIEHSTLVIGYDLFSFAFRLEKRIIN